MRIVVLIQALSHMGTSRGGDLFAKLGCPRAGDMCEVQGENRWGGVVLILRKVWGAEIPEK